MANIILSVRWSINTFQPSWLRAFGYYGWNVQWAKLASGYHSFANVNNFPGISKVGRNHAFSAYYSTDWHFPKQQILDSSKPKEFADDNFNFD